MNTKKIAIGTLCLTALLYLGGVEYYKKRALPRTYINEHKVSGLTLEEINKEMRDLEHWNEIDIIMNDEVQLTIKDTDINYEFYGNNEIREIVNSNSWFWITDLLSKKDTRMEMVSLFNYEKLKRVVENNELFQGETNNAKLTYSEENKQFIIEPHVCSVTLSTEQITDKIKKEINLKRDTIDLTEFILCPEILSDNENLINAKNNANDLLRVELTYNFGDRKDKEIVNGELIKNWIMFENNELTFNKELMREYIITLSDKYDTYGKPRTFKTTSGDTKTLSRSSYGWLIHRANSVDKLIQDITNGENKIIEPAYSYTAINRNQDDLGNSYVEIDINKQMVYVYEKGELKVSTPTVTGNINKGHATPLGIDPLTYKTTDAVLRGPGYAAPVKYWMPFNGGVGLHDANWRANFGGDIYKNNGSHGCINLPPNVAREVYDLVFPGMPVIVH